MILGTRLSIQTLTPTLSATLHSVTDGQTDDSIMPIADLGGCIG